MSQIEIRIPQLGEGLREARLTQFLKAPGEFVAADEPVFEMETDKALMEIEAPTAGVLAEWTAEIGQVLPIGAVIGAIATNSCSPPAPDRAPAPAAIAPALRNSAIPPRTRAYAREKGLSDEALAELAAAASGKLTPAEIDRFLDAQGGAFVGTAEPETTPIVGSSGGPSAQFGFRDIPISQHQRSLIFRIQQSAQQVIPATVEAPFEWGAIEELRRQLKVRPDLQLSQFMLFAWCVARAARSHPRFRCVMLNNAVLREYDHLNLGIAVSRPGDELLTARVDRADGLALEEFALRARDAIDRARGGENQIDETVQMTLSHLPGSAIRVGIPVVVAPAVVTMFVGSPFDECYPGPDGAARFRRVAVAVMTFDHRVVNGLGASAFVRSVQKQVAGLRAHAARLI